MASEEVESAVQDIVKKYYGETLQATTDLKTSACCVANSPHPLIKAALSNVPDEILMKFYGCGNPVPLGILGLTVLDLGSGTGRDCYVAAQLVSGSGKVIGIDMTESQLEVANKYKKEFIESMYFPDNILEFKHGYIEHIHEAGIQDNSIDLIISNCVINLSSRKDLVLEGCFRALKDGGEMYFSDVYCDRRLSEEVRAHKVLWGECLAGALYVEDFRELCKKVGFIDPRALEAEEILIHDPELKKVTGDAKFFSITYRLFKLKDLESNGENYGHTARYLGTMRGLERKYDLDGKFSFPKNKVVKIDGNTAEILTNSWLSSHFAVEGTKDTHLGSFDSLSIIFGKEIKANAQGCCGPKDCPEPTEKNKTEGCCTPNNAEKEPCCTPNNAENKDCCTSEKEPSLPKEPCCSEKTEDAPPVPRREKQPADEEASCIIS